MGMSAFTDEYNGQELVGVDPNNPFQCYAVAEQLCMDKGIPLSAIAHLDAYQIYTDATDETRQYFDIIPNTPEGVPPADAIVVFAANVPGLTGEAGHVDVATGVGDVNTFQTLDQNWDGLRQCQIVNHASYNGVLGWLVAKDNNTVQQEAPMTNDYNTLLHGPNPVKDNPNWGPDINDDISIDGLIRHIAQLNTDHAREEIDLNARLDQSSKDLQAAKVDASECHAVCDSQAKKIADLNATIERYGVEFTKKENDNAGLRKDLATAQAALNAANAPKPAGKEAAKLVGRVTVLTGLGLPTATFLQPYINAFCHFVNIAPTDINSLSVSLTGVYVVLDRYIHLSQRIEATGLIDWIARLLKKIGG